MNFLQNTPGLVLDTRMKRAIGAAIFILLLTCVCLLSANGITWAQCQYTLGDVNGTQGATALADVVYFVNYLRGGAMPPVDCGNPVGPCPEPSPFYAACDVNGLCNVNGIDVTYMVAYYSGPGLPFTPCVDCTPLLIAGGANAREPSNDPPIILTDPNQPDQIWLGNYYGTTINVGVGTTVELPIYVLNDEDVAALTITFKTDDDYLTPGGGTFEAPLSGWSSHNFLAPEHSIPGFTTQTILGYRILGGGSPPNLNTNGNPDQIGIFRVTVSPTANVGDNTTIFYDSHSRIGQSAFCNELGTDEWNPTCNPITLQIVGSNYGDVGGTVFYDADSDCIHDPGDIGLPSWTVTANPGGYSAATDQLGNFVFLQLPVGPYTLSEDIKPGWTQTCPAPPGTHSVNVIGGQFISGYDFGNFSSPFLDLACAVGGGPARPGFYKSIGVTYQNIGTLPSGADVVLTLPREVLYINCSPGGLYNDYITHHTVTWTLASFPPGWIDWLWVNVIIPVGTPLGTILTSSAQITPTSGTDNNLLDNTATESQIVTGSFDPNDKLVTPEGTIEQTDMLTYQIDFQNVGTDTAFNIVVRDTLDPNLNLSTFISGASIHPYIYTIAGREIVWTFPNILLPDSFANEAASNGFVKFSIYPAPGVPPGTIIENRASIFFDFNPPVVTNTVSNQIAMAPPCPYTPGDINNNDQVNGIDILYGVAYLKGGPTPKDTCDCRPGVPTFPFYAAMDVNGNCQINGLDITFFVAYLKSQQPALRQCADCPPARLRQR